jgi:sodium pump decarboxylase gamma subunit
MYSAFILFDKVLKGTEKMNGTQIVSMTVIGLLVVFSALLLLVLFLACSGSIFRKVQPGKKQPAPQKKAPAPAKPQQKPAPKAAPAAPAAKAAASAEDDSEVVAVIMAAIAAMSAADGKQYAVRSVRQVTRGGSGRSIWAQAGLSDLTRPF